MGESPMRWNLGVVGIAFYGALLGLCLALDRWLPEVFGWRWSGPLGPGWEATVGVVLGVLVVLVTWAIVRFSQRGYWLSRRLALATQPLPGWSLGPLAIAAGVAEEACFRGVLWTPVEYGLGTSFGPPVALVATSILFAWAHGGGKSGLRTWTLFALVTSVVLGGLRWWSGSLLAPMVTHALVDLIHLPLLRYRQEPLDEEP